MHGSRYTCSGTMSPARPDIKNTSAVCHKLQRCLSVPLHQQIIEKYLLSNHYRRSFDDRIGFVTNL